MLRRGNTACAFERRFERRLVRHAGHKAHTGDLRRCAKALRRSPVTGAAARVYPQSVQACEAGGERLLNPHEEVPWEELAAVRVTRQLQREAGCSGCFGGAW